MAEPTNQTQPNSQGVSPAGGASGENSEMISLDQLDGMILSEDPKFAADLADVNAIPIDANVDLDVVDLGQEFPTEFENPWKDAVGFRRVLVAIFPFLPRFWDFKFRAKEKLYFSKARYKTTLKQALPVILKATKSGVAAVGSGIKGRLSAFKSLSRSLKLIAIGLILLTAGIVFFIYRSITHGVLPAEKEMLSASLEEWSQQSYKYDAETEMDYFYDSPRTIQNIMSLPKMVVNIQRSASSGPNPMAAMEFFLEGLSPEAIVEVKDREPEVRDLFQRTIEEMTFDEIDGADGKPLLTERLRQAVNGVLTKGKIRRVFIKEAIIKP
ncbi:MAG: flagellar basal body-associated FliL family protein [Proteobacteria bacterium]|nr:MAG: flagellar basal body-associated FliL family protein [Pseudomonadota bacterium]